jgi:hypothetical protein
MFSFQGFRYQKKDDARHEVILFYVQDVLFLFSHIQGQNNGVQHQACASNRSVFIDVDYVELGYHFR